VCIIHTGRFISLLAVVASAHALVRGLAGAAAVAGLDLNAVQRAVIGVFAMILAALYTATDIMVGILLVHNNTSIFCAFRPAYIAQVTLLSCIVKNYIFHIFLIDISKQMMYYIIC